MLVVVLTIGASLSGCGREPAGIALLIPINPLCTTCDDFIRCDAAALPGEPVQGSDYQLFHLQPKPFLAQMATVFDYLLQAFRDREEDRRPLAVYSPAGRGREPATGAQAVTDLLQHRIAVPDGWIDQVNGEWHRPDDSVRGQCRLLPVADGRQLVNRLREASVP